MARIRIDDELGAPFLIKIGTEKIPFTQCYEFATIGHMEAGITQSVLKTYDKRYIHLTTVSDAEIPNAYGVHKGWYTASVIDEARANKLRESWAVLREQPGAPTGPFK